MHRYLVRGEASKAVSSRILMNTTNTLFVEFYVNETPTSADAGVTVLVKNPAGATVSTGAAALVSVGRYSYEVPASSTPTVYTVSWTGTFGGDPQTITQFYEVVENFMFSLADLRRHDSMADTVRFPTSALQDARDEATDLILHYTKASWGETYQREVVDGDASGWIVLRRHPLRRLLSLSINEAAQTLTQWTASESGVVRAKNTASPLLVRMGGQNVVVEYSYGYPFAVPRDVQRAALRLARHNLLTLPSSIPDRARMMTTEWGTFQLSTASEEYPTGLPEVDSVLRRYCVDIPGFA